jgi:hypothetical protein
MPKQADSFRRQVILLISKFSDFYTANHQRFIFKQQSCDNYTSNWRLALQIVIVILTTLFTLEKLQWQRKYYIITIITYVCINIS